MDFAVSLLVFVGGSFGKYLDEVIGYGHDDISGFMRRNPEYISLLLYLCVTFSCHVTSGQVDPVSC